VAVREVPAADPGQPAPAERRERRTRIAPIAAPASPAAAPPAATVPAAEREIVETAIGQILSRSAELAGMIDPEDSLPVDLILDHSRETVEQVIALLGPARSTGLRRVLGDLGEIQDIIMLMQLEKGHAPADDALTLLLQIRRDLETLITE